MRTRSLWGILVAGVMTASLAGIALGPSALADKPIKQTYFVCPSVSTNNPSGMWVIGFHGGYYVNIPTQGNGSKVYLTVPVQVSTLAQIPGGWALYKDLPSYPNFVGMAMLLQEGIEQWLGNPSGWSEGDRAMVVDNGDGSYTVVDMTQGLTIVIHEPIPLESAVVW